MTKPPERDQEKGNRGELGGDHARDTHPGLGDDYARDSGWSGAGRHDDFARDERDRLPGEDGVKKEIAPADLDVHLGKASE